MVSGEISEPWSLLVTKSVSWGSSPSIVLGEKYENYEK